jgi:hypothetical protein
VTTTAVTSVMRIRAMARVVIGTALALAVLVAIGRQPANAAGTAKKRAERLSRSARGSGQRRTAKPYADSHGCRKRLGGIMLRYG